MRSGTFRLALPLAVVVTLAPSERIDAAPTITWSTLLGDAQTWEDVRGVGTDAAGNIYVLLETHSNYTMVRNRLGTGFQFGSAVVVKLNPTGDEILYSTAVGAQWGVHARDLVVDAAGHAYVVGFTAGRYLPVVQPFQAECRRAAPEGPCQDAVLFKLDPTGASLEYATYFGGTGYDEAVALTVDAAGQATVVGYTGSADLPVASAYKPDVPACPVDEPWCNHVFMAKFAADGASLIFSTFLGGPGVDYVSDVAVDGQGDVYVTGAYGPGHPADFALTVGQGSIYNGNAFVSKLTAGGSHVFTSIVQGLTSLPLLAVEAGGAAHLLSTSAFGAVDASGNPEAEMCLVRINEGGDAVSSLRRLNGTGSEYPAGLSLDNQDRTLVAGLTRAQDWPRIADLPQTPSQGLWRSVDAGERFEPFGTDLGSLEALIVDPNIPQTLYASPSASGVYRSVDGGRTWERRSHGLPPFTTRALAFDRVQARLYALCGSAVYASEDGGASWALASSGLTGQVEAIAADPRRSVVAAATSEGLFVSSDGGGTWAKSDGAPDHLYGIVFDPVHDGTAFLMSSAYDRAGLYRTADGGTNWERTYAIASRTGATTIVSVAIDAIEGRRLLMTTDRGGAIHRSDDNGQTWLTPGYPSFMPKVFVFASPTVVYAAGTGLAVSRDAGDTWTTVGAGLPESHNVLLALPNEPDTLLTDAFRPSVGVMALFEPAATSPSFSSYIPGAMRPASAVLGAHGQLYVAGTAFQRDFHPTTNLAPPAAWDSDVAVLRIDLDPDGDGDGLPTTWELAFGLNPDVADQSGDADHDGLTTAEEFVAGTHPFGEQTQYLAEGAVSTFFDTTLALVNPSAGETAHVWLRFLTAGETAHRAVAVPPMTRRTLDVRTVTGLADAGFSTIVESDAPVAVTRTMSWNARGYGAHSEASIPAPHASWYFAEGATHSGFQLFFLIENPNPVAAAVRAAYLTGDGRTDVSALYQVAPQSRYTVWVNWIDGLRSADVAAVFTTDATTPIVVERAMYLDRAGQALGAGHGAVGAREPDSQWYFAEGATGDYFDLFLLLANPFTHDEVVDVTYLLPTGATVAKSYLVGARRRLTIWVDREDPALADTAVSIRLAARTDRIVAERAMWWPGPTAATWLEGHCTLGSTETHTRWAVADGLVGGERRAETYVLVGNPTGDAAVVQATLLFEDGAQASTIQVAPANSRISVPISPSVSGWWWTLAPDLAERLWRGARFAVVIDSSAAVVVESAVYWDARNAEGVSLPWAAGTSSRGTAVPMAVPP